MLAIGPRKGYKGLWYTTPYQFSPSHGLLQAAGGVSVTGGVELADFGSAGPLQDSCDAAKATASRQTKPEYCAIVGLSECEARQLQQYHFGSAVVL